MIALGGVEIRLRNTKGLLYLAHLLARPGKSVAAEELARIGSSAGQAQMRRVTGRRRRSFLGSFASDGYQGDQGGYPKDSFAGYLSRPQPRDQYSYWLFVCVSA